MRNPFCTPRKNNGISPISLLDRFREAVFRLIMLSALSKASNCERKSNDNVVKRSASYQHRSSYEPHHSEAVADCIEFIKKSTINEEDHHRDSTASSNSIDAAAGEVVLPVPVM